MHFLNDLFCKVAFKQLIHDEQFYYLFLRWHNGIVFSFLSCWRSNLHSDPNLHLPVLRLRSCESVCCLAISIYHLFPYSLGCLSFHCDEYFL